MIKKGIILAAGSGTRLNLLTKAVNKCLLPMYDKPMLLWAMQNLIECGIKDICVVVDLENIENYGKLLKNGSEYGVNISYVIQKEKNGVAGALKETISWANGSSVAVILGDGFFEENFLKDINSFKNGNMLFLKTVKDPYNYGCALVENDKIINIVEKPTLIQEENIYAITGMYFYDENVWNYLEKIEKSRRNEYEITDLNKIYIEQEKTKFKILQTFWSDLGTSVEDYCNLQDKIRLLKKGK
jgi:glucose-1-phosphate thymidylyltransferase